MASFNKVILMGNLTRDPEVRYTNSGVPVATLRLAVSETFRRRDTNEQVERTCFVDVQAWQRQAETCEQYLSKGRPVLVEGRLELNEWETSQGEKRSMLRVRADRVQFLGSARRDAYSDTAQGPVSQTPPSQGGAQTPPQPKPSVPQAAPVAPQTPSANTNNVPVDSDLPDDDNLPF